MCKIIKPVSRRQKGNLTLTEMVFNNNIYVKVQASWPKN